MEAALSDGEVISLQFATSADAPRRVVRLYEVVQLASETLPRVPTALLEWKPILRNSFRDAT
jgi:hypothetical protein